MSEPALSVILCTHNPRADYLARTLAALQAQTLPFDRWEFILVDNASESPLEAALDLSWHPHGRVVREDQAGLTMARLRGFKEAAADLLVLVDDDNLLAPGYLETALALAAHWPILGAWGGQSHPEFEETPPEWTRDYWNWIAIREFTGDLWSNVPRALTTAPSGAGMCLRRRVAAAYVEGLEQNRARTSLGRARGELFGGEDTDLALTACDLGLGTGLFSALELTHLIPKSRLEESYLLKLVRAMTYSATLLAYFRGERPMLPDRTQRLLRWYQRWRIPAREARFADAARFGEEAAACDIARLDKNLPPLGLPAVKA